MDLECPLFKNAEPAIKNHFLMGSPLPGLGICLAYFLFVFKIGPAYMKNRQPMKLDKIIMTYNLLQIILNGYVFYRGLLQLPRYSIFCSPKPAVITEESDLIFLQYSYTLLKFLDLCDTIFFVLRKKQNQITFLHLYHHSTMVVCTWLITKFYLGGQVYFLGLPNLFVHTVMYFYYFLTAWNPSYRANVWWKKYITQLQIGQHCFIFVSFLLPLLNPDCDYSKGLLVAFLANTSLMIYLFVSFYIKAYIRPQVKAK